MSEKDTAPDLWVMLGFVVLVGVVAFGFGRAGSKSSHVSASRPMTYGESGRLVVPSKKRQRSTGFSQPARPSRPVNRYGGAVQVHYADDPRFVSERAERQRKENLRRLEFYNDVSRASGQITDEEWFRESQKNHILFGQ